MTITYFRREKERERDAYITYHEMSEIDYGPSHTRRAAKNWEHKEPREEEDENIGGPNPRVHEPLCVPIQIRRWHSFHIQARHSQIPVYGFWFGDPLVEKFEIFGGFWLGWAWVCVLDCNLVVMGQMEDEFEMQNPKQSTLFFVLALYSLLFPLGLTVEGLYWEIKAQRRRFACHWFNLVVGRC